MARTRTLAELRDDARRRCDQQSESANQRFPDTEVDRYINEGLAELWDMLCEARGFAYFGKSTTISIISGTQSYTLPSDFFKLHTCRIAESAIILPLLPVSLADEEFLLNATVRIPTHYQLRANFIDFYPIPGGSYTATLTYVPWAKVLVGDGDFMDGIDGYESYCALFAAREMARRDEDFELFGTLEASMSTLRERIARMSPTRDEGHAPKVKDTRNIRRGFVPARWWVR